MIIKNLFNPILDGVRYTGFINAVNDVKEIDGEWINGENAINKIALDNVIKLRCGRRSVYSEFDGVTRDTYNKISDILSSYKYELDGLYETLFFEYNPIDNYDRTETQTATNTMDYGKTQNTTQYGEQTNTTQYGEQTNTTQYGEKNSANVYGATNSTTSYGGTQTTTNYGEVSRVENIDGVTQTNDIGERTQTNNNGERVSSDNIGTENRTSTTTNSTSAFDGGEYDAKTDKTTNTENVDARTNSHTDNAFVDSVTNSRATDTATTSARVDEYITSTHTDATSVNAHNDTVTNDTHTDTAKEQTHTDTVTDASHTDTVTDASHTDTVKGDAHTDINNSSYSLRARGNIGTMSSQTMIEQERNVRMFNFFDYVIDIIYNEITTLNYEV